MAKKNVEVGEGARSLDALLKKRGKVKKPKSPSNVLKWNLEPERENTGMAEWYFWTTECGRYRVGRSMFVGELGFVASAKNPDTDNFDTHVELDPEEKGANYPRKYKRLEGALDSVEQHLQEQLGDDQEVVSNMSEVLEAADKLGLAYGKKGDPPLRKKRTPSQPTQDRPQPTPPSKKEDPPSKKSKPVVERSGRSNKEVVYTAWEEGETDPEALLALLPEDSVKLSSIKSWLGAWKHGHNLPACAR